jgi:nicotinamide-nucleotide amidase
MVGQRIEVLVIGDELLDGRVVDTNSVRLAEAIAKVGLRISQRTAVTDDIDAIAAEVLAIAARKTTLCVVSGGLGPTSDDLTALAFAKAAGVEVTRDKSAAKQIEDYLHGRNREVTPNHLRQADRPQGATLLANGRGTAPGFEMVVGGCTFVAFPGVPHEFDAMVHDVVVTPRSADTIPLVTRSLYLFGIIEADVDHRLSEIGVRYPEVRLQFRVYFPEVHVSMHAAPEHQEALDAAYAYASSKLQAFTFATEASPFAAAILAMLLERKEKVAVAESCTGGLVTDMLTDQPGSSEALHVGITAYDNLAKNKLLGVSEETLQKFGAVSEATVLQMAQGVRKILGSTYGIAISGVAGPGGGSADKPVGTLWFGLAWEGGEQATHLLLPWDRRNNKIVSAYTALDLLRRHLQLRSGK